MTSSMRPHKRQFGHEQQDLSIRTYSDGFSARLDASRQDQLKADGYAVLGHQILDIMGAQDHHGDLDP